MIGNRVRVITEGDRRSAVEGTLQRLDAAGATVWRTDGMPEAQGAVFIPMRRVVEIVDLGREP